jgi:phosphomethylpyrimidine synthase
MQITRDLREEAAVIAEREKGMAAKSAEFIEKGAEIYVPETAVAPPSAG